MRPFCEVMVQEVFPTVRALIARELMETFNYNQAETAQKMGVTQPAISQYKRELRGKKAKLLESNATVFGSIKNAAKLLTKAKNTFESGILCSVCRDIRKSGMLCKLHREAIPLLKNCNLCLNETACR
ncbi:Uncharacterised protein [uncultured archaeon]|nr:Uncharacterised protein [uncultured archaeon]